MQIESLFIYPIKSGAGIEVSALEFDARGPIHDRRWMVVRPDGSFLTQRNHPTLGAVAAVPVESGLVLTIAQQPPLLVPAPESNEPLSCSVWFDQVLCLDCGEEAAVALSEHLQEEVRLVYADETHFERGVHLPPQAAEAGPAEVSLADGFPLLLVSAAALTQLSERFGQEVSVRRFRPNIVIGGADAHAEDNWQRIRVGETELAIVKPCVRCSIPALDPDEMTETPGFNRTLATYRKFDGRIIFGQNALVKGKGKGKGQGEGKIIRVGDPVDVLDGLPTS